MKTGFILIAERDVVFNDGAQPGQDAYQQQIYYYKMQPRFVHACFAASAVPVLARTLSLNPLLFNDLHEPQAN